ncbi:penicillin-binding transpeptidase domain-containing protein [Lentzea sp. BCCO 10_0061]|uniref:Penicillin-binding transpeptidase domain-containing protein n=1 Tax=Lentzea sokolovensis TaxID=3095429 RepID=A0ABU4VE35_9PSEU|nr:penicillin-binding transpeptidase domain-containing protein [Lentzea sp. BCCO 10_0061]MDX8149449.1 penicillin-binding transpeptidase domain-containing protein [Lentzea sp. BCCO 10_0061]
MEPKTRRWILISGALATTAIVGVAGALLWSGSRTVVVADEPAKPAETPSQIASSFLTRAFSGPASAAVFTDAPAVAAPALEATKAGMGTSVYQATLTTSATPSADATTAELAASVVWRMPNANPLAYDIKISMKRVDGTWKVHWTPALIHPQLTEGASLTYRQTLADGALLGRDGKPLVQGTIPDGLYKSIVSTAGDVKGTDGWEVGITAGGAFTRLHGKDADMGEKITVTIDPTRQAAAQAAVDALPQGAAIVAIEASTSEILAVAQNRSLNGTNPFIGRYAPGSTMKIVTAAAAMNAGLVQSGTAVPCPAKATIGTRTITNAGFGHDSVPFHTAFALSCNTTFGDLGSKLDANALPAMAKRFGLGADWTIPGADTNTGKVPPATGDQQVENSFGQGNVIASPFGMALVAATVVSGKTPAPTLMRGKPSEPNDVAAPPPAAVLQPLRAMMREVVTSGTAKQLAGIPGLAGKTGTAEAGGGTAHGWFVGYQNNVAFAVVVENAGSSASALDATATFLK